ncbi:radical SAM protein [Candidatus Woesearchaeota archaeon]|nr:radical SAM protein [Candidatus Woesearchaeota archaeon]
MGVLLFRPRLLEEHAEWLAPPLGLLYIAAVFEKNQVPVAVYDLAMDKLTDEEIKTKVREMKPDLIGIGPIVTVTNNNASRLAKAIREVSDAPILIAGPHPSVMPLQCLQEMKADVVVHGEAEGVVFNLYKAITEGGSLQDVDGISFQADGRLVRTKAAEPIMDMDSIPFPARHLVPFHRYLKLRGSREMFTRNYPVTSITTSRGCPFRCTFCSRPFGLKWRARSPKNIVDEMELLARDYGIREINIEDENFSLDRDRAMAVCDELIRRNLGLTIKFPNGLKPEKLDLELLQKMKQAGVFYVAFGIESGSPEVVKRIKKGVTLERIQQTINWAKQVGMITHGFFMIGHPDETREDFERTIEFAKNSGLDVVGLSTLTPYPGTEVYADFKAKGMIKEDNWDAFFLHGAPAFNGSKMTSDEILKFKKKFYPSVYLRPKYLLWTLPRLIVRTGFKPRDTLYYLNRFLRLAVRGRLA